MLSPVGPAGWAALSVAMSVIVPQGGTRRGIAKPGRARGRAYPAPHHLLARVHAAIMCGGGQSILDRSIKRLSTKARRGMRGHPMGIVACYGPDERRASKLVASVKNSQDAEPTQRKWF